MAFEAVGFGVTALLMESLDSVNNRKFRRWLRGLNVKWSKWVVNEMAF